MTYEELKNLQIGDKIKPMMSCEEYVVVERLFPGNAVVAVQTAVIKEGANSSTWEKVDEPKNQTHD